MIKKINSKTLIIAMFIFASCAKTAGSENNNGDNDWPAQDTLPAVDGQVSFNLAANEDFVNVMGVSTPRMPKFPALQAKKNFLRGYVVDLNGKPLKGAIIGVRSTQDGGWYSGVSGETNEKGYYEFKMPNGAASFYVAGYTIDYGQGRAPVSLYPADGRLESFASANGSVGNFVLMPYGIADRDKAGQKPRDEANYFGGSLYFSYIVDDPSDIYTDPGQLPANAEILITLTPDGETLYGETRTFIINKRTALNNFSVLNIPVGRYTISAKMKDGRQLKLRATGTYATAYPFFGLKPAEAMGSAKVMFTPLFNSSQSTVVPGLGNWRMVQIKLELP